MKRLEIGSSAFDQLSLHDVRVYAFVRQRQQYEVNLSLDIDYLAEWNRLPDDRHDFLVVPATLTFMDVVDLQIHLDWGTLDRLHKKGYISDPKSKALSFVVNEEGLSRAKELFEKLFAK